MKMISAAQNTTQPTVVEGRVWNVVRIIPSEPPESDTTPGYYKDIKGRWGVGSPYTYKIEGDTIMGGLAYKKLCLDGRFVSGLREENGYIYECYWDGYPEQLAFDFNLQSGDIFKSEVNDMEQLEVKQVRTFNFAGTNRRCMDIWVYLKGEEIINGLVDYWIEGIGCMGGPHSPFWWDATSGSSLLLSCYDGDECIFNVEELNQFTNCPSSCPDDKHPHAIDLGLPSGTKWACCNVGATTPEGYGGYYAWGETEEKDYYDRNTYQYYQNGSYVNLGSDIAGTGYDVAHVKWGSSWVMPSLDQIKELVNNCTYTWTLMNGVLGGQFSGPTSGNIFLPAAGYRCYYSGLYVGGSLGYYWSSTPGPSYSIGTYFLSFDSGGVLWYDYSREDGHTVRPVISGTTNISLSNPSEDKSAYAVYNLYGMKVADNMEQVSNLLPGVYIVNGKKVVVK